jgi:hypothetical protein
MTAMLLRYGNVEASPGLRENGLFWNGTLE